jgi:class 3 adenylate cyclase
MNAEGKTRRLTTVLATDVVGYSAMTARDEDHTVRLVRQRFATVANFVERHEGRVFNTAGDALLAEFASPVEAVRCALEVQEAMRTANQLADENDRLQLRIGVNLGDVIVSGDDLLGDGVNIASRLESIAPVGGVCVSASVYDQLVGKLTLGAEDLGEQHVKNIPRPIRAYRLTPQGSAPLPPASPPASVRPARKVRFALVASIAALLAAAGAAALTLPSLLAPAPPPPVAAAPAATAAEPPRRLALVPEDIPFLDDRAQERIRASYLRALDAKALAISPVGHYGWATQRVDETAARKEALANCSDSLKRALPGHSQQVACMVYAVGDDVVWTFKPPPMPPQPWVPPGRPAPATALDPTKTPLVSDSTRRTTASGYMPAPASKAMAIGRNGSNFHTWNRATDTAAMRAALQSCGYLAQRPCFVYALNDEVVVRVPEIAKTVDVLAQDDLAGVSDADRQRIESAYLTALDWRALAVGRNGRIGLATRAASEQQAIDQALRNCQDGGGLDCGLVAIGPFKVSMR